MLEDVSQAISTLERHPDRTVREATRDLLAGIDAVHRTGLTHLVQGIHGMAGEAFLNRLAADPAIRLLLMSYDLIAVDRRLQAEEALDTVRGHLHDHGVDVELSEVIGGVVYIRLHGAHAHAGGQRPAPGMDATRRDLEAALREGLLGFQELVIGERGRAEAQPVSVPVTMRRPARKPVYMDAGPDDLQPDAIRPAIVNEVPILLAVVDGTVHAVHDRCGESPLPLHFGSIDGPVVTCSWHGCRYDVRSGIRLDAPGRLRVYPVAVHDGRIRVALDVGPPEGRT